jgi:hypothetical protein
MAFESSAIDKDGLLASRIYEGVHLTHLTLWSIPRPLVMRSAIKLCIFIVNLTVLDQVIHLEDLVARLRLQVHLVVSHMIQITIACRIQLSRDELVCRIVHLPRRHIS